MVIFRENTEDIYAGIEYSRRVARGEEGPRFPREGVPEGVQEDPVRHRGGGARVAGSSSSRSARRTGTSASRSASGSSRSAGSAPSGWCTARIGYAIKFGRKSVTLVHKGNIMKFTEGAFRDWGYQVAKDFYGAVEIDGGPWCRIPEGKPGAGLVIKDAIADITLQQVLTRPDEFDVIATPNLNGDYLSDALAAQVGGIGIAPGGNINYVTGHAVFEATHGTAPKYADQDKVNPGSVILSGEMMLRHLGWTEAADLVVKGMDGAIAAKRVTYDFARLMEGATELKTSEFGDAIIKNM